MSKLECTAYKGLSRTNGESGNVDGYVQSVELCNIQNTPLQTISKEKHKKAQYKLSQRLPPLLLFCETLIEKHFERLVRHLSNSDNGKELLRVLISIALFGESGLAVNSMSESKLTTSNSPTYSPAWSPVITTPVSSFEKLKRNVSTTSKHSFSFSCNSTMSNAALDETKIDDDALCALRHTKRYSVNSIHSTNSSVPETFCCQTGICKHQAQRRNSCISNYGTSSQCKNFHPAVCKRKTTDCCDIDAHVRRKTQKVHQLYTPHLELLESDVAENSKFISPSAMASVHLSPRSSHLIISPLSTVCTEDDNNNNNNDKSSFMRTKEQISTTPKSTESTKTSWQTNSSLLHIVGHICNLNSEEFLADIISSGKFDNAGIQILTKLVSKGLIHGDDDLIAEFVGYYRSFILNFLFDNIIAYISNNTSCHRMHKIQSKDTMQFGTKYPQGNLSCTVYSTDVDFNDSAYPTKNSGEICYLTLQASLLEIFTSYHYQWCHLQLEGSVRTNENIQPELSEDAHNQPKCFFEDVCMKILQSAPPVLTQILKFELFKGATIPNLS